MFWQSKRGKSVGIGGSVHQTEIPYNHLNEETKHKRKLYFFSFVCKKYEETMKREEVLWHSSRNRFQTGWDYESGENDGKDH